jgi:hypothetical protein
MNDARLLTIPEVVGVKVRGGRRITEASVAAYVAGLIAEAA